MSPLTILHLAANRWWTGSADPIIHLAKGLEQRGHRVLLGVIRGDRFEAKAREAGLIPLSGLSLEPRGLPADLVRLRRLVRRERVQIIHCHHSHDHWIGALSRQDAVLFRTFHNLRAAGRRGIARHLYRRTAGAFAVSRQIYSRCVEVGFKADRVWLLAGSADLHRFTPETDGRAVRDELGIGSAPVVGSVARLAPNRGHELLIEGFRLVLDKLPDARLLLIGKGESRPKLEALVSELGLARRVLFTGYRDHDLPEYLAIMDCFVLMGAGSDESCRAALEAMASGKPVVARTVGALPETIVHEETGLLLPDDRPESIAAALLALVENPERAQRMGGAGRRRAETEFNPERTAETVEAAYRLLRDRQSGRGDNGAHP
ncbi:MAG: glycosyltransferase family 4 protein [Candidatus Methylomirabilia bacterium]